MHYSGCNVLVSDDMIKYIQGYVLHMVLDASLLPGSQGQRKCIVVVKGPMLSPESDISVIMRWLKPVANPVNSQPGFYFPLERPVVQAPVSELETEPLPTPKTEDIGMVPTKNMYEFVNSGFKAILENNRNKAMMKAQLARSLNEAMMAETPDSLDKLHETVELVTLAYVMVNLIFSFVQNQLVDCKVYFSALGLVNQPTPRELFLHARQQ
eukprot:GILJ01023823.1.p1 GENE.GILJ01023823.1~~GILJ01023823.1.p1  ORF type:complete len:211 (-),score=21.74 GILJ01023823.1:155-787(-)